MEKLNAAHADKALYRFAAIFALSAPSMLSRLCCVRVVLADGACDCFDAYRIACPEQVGGAVDDPIRQRKPMQHLDFDTEISPEGHGFDFDLVVRTNRRDLQTILTEHQGAGRHANNVGVVRQNKFYLGV